MTCDEFTSALLASQPGAPLSPEAIAHLETCPNCRRLYESLSAAETPVSPPAATLRAIESKLLGNLVPVRPIVPGVYFFLFTALFLALVTAVVVWLGPAALSVKTHVQITVMCAAFVISATSLASSLARQMVPAAKQLLAPHLSVIAIVAGLALLIAILYAFQSENQFLLTAWGCIRTGGLIALAILLPFTLLLRSGAILYPAATGATAGLLAGLSGSAVLEWTCRNTNASHILFAHLGVALLAATFGFLIGRAAEQHSA